MGLVTADAAAVAALALVCDNNSHAAGLSDDAAPGLHALRRDVGKQTPHADATDLLVVGQREMHRLLQPAPQPIGHESKRDRAKALHVGDAAAEDAVSDDRCLKR